MHLLNMEKGDAQSTSRLKGAVGLRCQAHPGDGFRQRVLRVDREHKRRDEAKCLQVLTFGSRLEEPISQTSTATRGSSSRSRSSGHLWLGSIMLRSNVTELVV